jgi:hypothetical protein
VAPNRIPPRAPGGHRALSCPIRKPRALGPGRRWRRARGAVPPGEHELNPRSSLTTRPRAAPLGATGPRDRGAPVPPGVLRTSVWVDEVPGLRVTVGVDEEPRAARAPDGTPGRVVEVDAPDAGDVATRVPIRLEGLPRRGAYPFLTASGPAGFCFGALAGLGRIRAGPAAVSVDLDAPALASQEFASLERRAQNGDIGRRPMLRPARLWSRLSPASRSFPATARTRKPPATPSGLRRPDADACPQPGENLLTPLPACSVLLRDPWRTSPLLPARGRFSA